MPLEFLGMALMDPPKRRVRFAGYPIGPNHMQITICGVSVSALLALAGEQDLSESEIMGIFELHKEAIFSAASAQFDAGSLRPQVEANNLAGVLSQDASQ